MGYGYEAKEHNDRKVNAARTLMQLSSEINLPGATLVNDLPFCECSLWFWIVLTRALLHNSTTHS
jgi:hypothetical protein